MRYTVEYFLQRRIRFEINDDKAFTEAYPELQSVRDIPDFEAKQMQTDDEFPWEVLYEVVADDIAEEIVEIRVFDENNRMACEPRRVTLHPKLKEPTEPLPYDRF